ncbi:MAG: tRNA (adenosine(37)-N6)-threonylcarbamoyltransferase complex dimerization subunit type 1 TsaB [Treponema sp.]|uniref:tRNA (adenosine(37)-N6)-threonylcarbamoyltransferase complex dimerization subunit type 1 TsaB n=1 Tax=Treponema sp. TaxID=166 RepID=UPI00298E7473|nr:tRNA (adenosine(37)-N6)-threonylcarbamoyltransferase complex dimerization subunit type 1 TsaB [Treponema sp.]MCR5387239.1 tRNA (adenosine(37)-N6)-threonylcarbamoyltransferase complex dimerization subunit type 1 TsaB [Treponema sp.]
MKALAIDTSLTRITICAKNDDNTAYLTLDIGMRQSEKLLPSIEYVLSQVDLKTSDLDYTVLCKGPGSFTGLRLSFSALKAIELSHGTPLYGVGTLEAYSYAYSSLPFPVICAVDAKKNRFYVRINKGTENIIEDGDYEIDAIAEKIAGLESSEFFVCGSDAELFIERIKKDIPSFNKKLFCLKGKPNETENLFAIAEDMIAKKIPALKDFEGPVYIRASEAEEHLTSKASS